MSKTEERMLELLADQAIAGLDAGEQQELSALQSENPELVGDQSFDAAAAAFNLASIQETDEIPDSLLNKLREDATGFFGEEDEQEEDIESTVREVVFEKPTSYLAQWLGWAVAGFASIALAAILWVGGIPTSETAQTPPPETKPPTAVEKRESLLAAAPEMMRLTWDSPDKDVTVSGDVVWNEEKQEGYMKFSGLPVNDRDKEAYQLWIFDEAQSDETPVDGGVFDITKEGEVIVPIDAKIAVTGAKMFAVTVERPGGVVVSKREKIVALAKLS
jgi:hypothetical protein